MVETLFLLYIGKSASSIPYQYIIVPVLYQATAPRKDSIFIALLNLLSECSVSSQNVLSVCLSAVALQINSLTNIDKFPQLDRAMNYL